MKITKNNSKASTFFFCVYSIKRNENNLIFGNKGIHKSPFYKNKQPSDTYKVDVNKIVIPKKDW